MGKRIKFSSDVLNWHIRHLLSLLLKIEYLLNIPLPCLYAYNLFIFYGGMSILAGNFIYIIRVFIHTHTKLDSSCRKVWQLNKS